MSRLEIRDLLSGDIGTPVVLRLERQGKSLDVPLVRGVARIDINGQHNSPVKELPAAQQAGLGLAIEIVDEHCTVLDTVAGGAAHGCGKIMPGDLLLAVRDPTRASDFVPTAGLDFPQVRGMILGPPGSQVTLKMQQSRARGGAVYLCEDLVRGAPGQAPAPSPPQPKPSPTATSHPVPVSSVPPTLHPHL